MHATCEQNNKMSKKLPRSKKFVKSHLTKKKKNYLGGNCV